MLPKEAESGRLGEPMGANPGQRQKRNGLKRSLNVSSLLMLLILMCSFCKTSAQPFTLEECLVAMDESDEDDDDFMNQNEYSIFINILSNNGYRGLKFSEFPVELRRNYFSATVEPEGQVDIFGSKPDQTADPAQQAYLDTFCGDTEDVLFENDAPTSAPFDGDLDQSCLDAMVASDADDNELMNQAEYTTFVNILSANEWRDTTFPNFPTLLRQNYFQLVTESNQIDIYGSRGDEDPPADQEQQAYLDLVCRQTRDTINVELGIPTPAPTPRPTTGTVSPSDIPSSLPSWVPSQHPSLSPSEGPSDLPSYVPSNAPSESSSPTSVPSVSNAPTQAVFTGPIVIRSVFIISNTAGFTASSMPDTTRDNLADAYNETALSVTTELAPVITEVPSETPSLVPSVAPSVTPSTVPSVSPKKSPAPTESIEPSASPTDTPAPTKTPAPSSAPSAAPSTAPSPSPSADTRRLFVDGGVWYLEQHGVRRRLTVEFSNSTINNITDVTCPSDVAAGSNCQTVTASYLINVEDEIRGEIAEEYTNATNAAIDDGILEDNLGVSPLRVEGTVPQTTPSPATTPAPTPGPGPGPTPEGPTARGGGDDGLSTGGIVGIVIALLAVGAAAGGGYYYYTQRDRQPGPTGPGMMSEADMDMDDDDEDEPFGDEMVQDSAYGRDSGYGRSDDVDDERQSLNYMGHEEMDEDSASVSQSSYEESSVFASP